MEKLTFHQAYEQLMNDPNDEDTFIATELSAYDICIQIYRAGDEYKEKFLVFLMAGESLNTFSLVTDELESVLGDFSIDPNDARWDIW